MLFEIPYAISFVLLLYVLLRWAYRSFRGMVTAHLDDKIKTRVVVYIFFGFIALKVLIQLGRFRY